MIYAIATVHGPNGLWITKGGYEHKLVLIVAALVPAMAGAGDWSLDAAIGWDVTGVVWGLAALVVGAAAAAGALASRRTDDVEKAARRPHAVERQRAA